MPLATETLASWLTPVGVLHRVEVAYLLCRVEFVLCVARGCVLVVCVGSRYYMFVRVQALARSLG